MVLLVIPGTSGELSGFLDNILSLRFFKRTVNEFLYEKMG
ncbi:hypothetical protein SAMN05660816_02204 [Niastella yeongjuensis]|nr:hypothetical protein SAMN05660816_02204 [Niastella yeongjuensis]